MNGAGGAGFVIDTVTLLLFLLGGLAVLVVGFWVRIHKRR